jgi:DNA-binding transcriptional regulator LsrR (DeoR family)
MKISRVKGPASVRKPGRGTSTGRQDIANTGIARNKRRRLRQDLIVELALERYAGYRTHHKALTPISELQEWARTKDLVLSPHAISHYVVQAFKKGWVEVAPAAPGRVLTRQWQREDEEAQELTKVFQSYGLRDAIVISGVTPPAAKTAFVDDPFYQALGQAMAEWIAKSPFIKRGDCVGVGSGRAVYNTIKALETYKPLNIPNLTLLSLSGNAWSRPDRQPRSVDADFNVTLLRECCARAQPVYIAHPLTASDSRESTSLRQSTLPNEQWEREVRPDVALVGVGSLQENHRFWVSPTDNVTLDVLLTPIREELRQLVKLFSDLRIANYSPVADIANHLVFVPHPDKDVAAKVKEREIRAALDHLNARLLNVSDAQFSEIRSIALTAGEKSKAYAIRELITNPSYNVEYLCTDVETARELRDLERRYAPKMRSLV